MTDNTEEKIEEVKLGDGEPETQTRDPDSFDRGGGFFGSIMSGDVERNKPPQDALDKYWRQYESTGIVRKSINTYTNDIIEPGYTVVSDDENLQQRMNSWLSEAAILNGEQDKPFIRLLEDVIRQREVRGTALVEVVPQQSNPDGIWGFRLINVESVSAIEREDTGTLVRPDETELEDVPITKRGEAAAYIQYDDAAYAGPFDEDDVALSQNDVVKLVLDGDAYDIFGTSRLESCSKDIEIRDKVLEDNAEAIAAKGYPHWIFKMGEPNPSEDNPRRGVWPDDKIQQLRNEHKSSNFSAGQKDFLPGDVSVDVVHGETADIKPTIKHHTEEILAAMPTPKFMVGHADAVNRDITQEQYDVYKTQVRKARRQLEGEFLPVLKRKAREWGFDGDAVESLELRIERQTQESPLKNEDFDAQDFKAMAEGMRAMEKSNAVSVDEMRQNFLGLPPQDNADGSPDTSNDSPDSDEKTSGQN